MKIISNCLTYLGSLFLKGLLALLPIALTFIVIRFCLTVTKNWLDSIHPYLPTWIPPIPYIELVVVIVFIFAVGIILHSFFIEQILNYLESIIAKIPLVKSIYVSSKQLVNAFGSQDQGSFKQVVLVEFPRKDSYSIGFLTGQFPSPLAPHHDIPFFSVFVPATPNPTSGFYLIVPESAFTIINLTRQEAMALIISGGIIVPDRLKVNDQNGQQKI